LGPISGGPSGGGRPHWNLVTGRVVTREWQCFLWLERRFHLGCTFL